MTWSLLEERGAAFTVGEVAMAAGVSRQAVYLHFGSRAGLLVETVQHQDERAGIDARFGAAMERTSAVAALEAALEVWFDYLPVIREVVEVLSAAALADEDARTAVADRSEAQRQGMAAFLERVEQEGCLNPAWTAREAAELLWSLVHVSAWNQLVGECGWAPERFAESRMELVRRVLLTAGGELDGGER